MVNFIKKNMFTVIVNLLKPLVSYKFILSEVNNIYEVIQYDLLEMGYR